MINEAYIDRLSSTVPKPKNEYKGADGLLHCAVCNKSVQVRISVFGKEKTVRCVCRCVRKEMEQYEAMQKRDELERQRRICFSETNMSSWSFENDDRRNPKLSDAMMRYADKFSEFRQDSKGLILYGTVGTGKTYYAACIANRLIDNGYRVFMTNFARLVNETQGFNVDKQKYINSLNRYDLLIIDDLGAERRSEFMQEQVFNIIDSRYRSGLPFIITTNLSGDELKKPQEIGYSRIYDRILERCFPIEVTGQSRRRKALKDTHADTKAKLGL